MANYLKYIIVPSWVEQFFEIVKMIVQELYRSNPQKLAKRITRISFGISIPGILTELEKIEIRRLLSVVPEKSLPKGLFPQIATLVNNLMVDQSTNLVRIMANPFATSTDLPRYQSFESEEKMNRKKEEEAFLTEQMHQSPVLFILACWINNLMMKELTDVFREYFDRGEILCMGKGGGFFGFHLLLCGGLSVETAEDIYKHCNLGDADYGFYICNDIENREELRTRFCNVIADVAGRIKIAFFGQGTIFSDLIASLVTQRIKDAGFNISSREDIQMEEMNGIKGLFFNELIVKDRNGYNGSLFFSNNNTLKFNRDGKKTAFLLQRLCVAFEKNGILYKAELIDWATPSFDDDDIVKGKFYSIVNTSVECNNFTTVEYIDLLLQRLPGRLSVKQANLMKILMTFTL